MVATDLESALEWARDLANCADVGHGEAGTWWAYHALIRALGSGLTEQEARDDLRDYAYEWAIGVKERGDNLAIITPTSHA